jgi:hypothetical protein
MLTRSLLTTIGICCLFFLLLVENTQGGELIIHDGGTITVETDSTLFMNCNDLTIESGGTFIVNGGAVEERGKLVLESGGLYSIISGTVEKCYKSFYVIPGSNGRTVIICL